MKAIAFDTLEFAKKLRTANFSNEQAEAMAEAIAAVVTEQLATKADIADVRRDLADVRRELKESEYRLTIRLGTMLAAAIAAVAALVKLL